MSMLADFFRDEQILITGGTGFVGKLLISKLLLSCSKLKKIILLIRKKMNKNLEFRKNELFSDKIFDTLKNKNPGYMQKIEFVEGNCEHSQLGLTQIDKFLITQHVTIIFHCAADVKFDQDLKTEININVFGALEILNLAKLVKNLKALVYVSSSYSNCHRTVVEEKYYEPNVHYSNLLKLTESNLLNTYEKHILGDVKNTYFYTKASAEQVIFESGRNLPIAIFRPSAIISTWKEPIPGWTNKAFAPTALVKSVILGYISSILCTDDLIIDMVPGDLTVNALIAVAWDTHFRYINGTLNEPRVYNYVSMIDNPITLKTFFTTVFKMIPEKPYTKSLLYPTVSYHDTKLANTLHSLLRPRLLTFSIQLCNFFQKNKSKIAKSQNACRNYDFLMDLLENIISRPHIYTNDNIRQLWNDMNENDKQHFNFDVKGFQWADYLKHYYDGVLQFVLKEENRDEMKAKRHFFRLRIMYYATEALFYIAGICMLYWVFLCTF